MATWSTSHVEDLVENPTGEWLPLTDAAARLGLSVDTTRKKARRGQLIARQSPRPQGHVWEVYIGADLVKDQVDDQERPGGPSADLVHELLAENRRLSDQNVQLAGQLGYLQAQYTAAVEQLKLIEAPEEAPRPRRRWYWPWESWRTSTG